MEYIRQTIDSEKLSGFLELPLSLRNTKVEIIVLPAQSETVKNTTTLKRGTAFGCLKKYANPTLIEQEKGAWERAVTERYANH